MKLRDISKIKSKSELKQKIEEYQEKMLQEKKQDKKIELGYIFDSLRGQYDKVVMQECYDRLKKVSSIEEKRKIMVDHLEIDLTKITKEDLKKLGFKSLDDFSKWTDHEIEEAENRNYKVPGL